MNRVYLLGIDAGATKTAYALYDAESGVTFLGIGGGGNHENMPGGYDQLYEVMKKHIGLLCTATGIQPEDITAAGLGIAGVDTIRQYGIISDIFRKIGLKQIGLANDALLGIKAESDDGTGICAANGTGFSVYGMDALGKTSQVGGFGELTGDKGGGSYYAYKGFEAVFRYLEKEGPKTCLADMVFEELGIHEASRYMEAVSERMEGNHAAFFIKTMSILVHQAAAGGDPVARKILEESGSEYAASILGVVRHLPDLIAGNRLTVVLVGSCFLRSACSLVKDTMLSILESRLPGKQISIKPIRTEPVTGALLWANELANPGRTAIQQNRIRESFSNAQMIF